MRYKISTQPITLVGIYCLAVILLAIQPTATSALTIDISGEFEDYPGPFGGTGLEGGTFSGTFSYDPAAVDQYPDSEPMGDIYGIYDMTDWDIDLFFSDGSFASEFNSAGGGTSSIAITPDPDTVGVFGNIALEFQETAGDFGLSGTFPVIFGLYFDLPTIATDALPMDVNSATYTGDGLLGYFVSADSPATFIESASISNPATVPEPTTAILFGTGLVGLVGSRLRKKKK